MKIKCVDQECVREMRVWGGCERGFKGADKQTAVPSREVDGRWQDDE